jgi:hypothetical protein
MKIHIAQDSHILKTLSALAIFALSVINSFGYEI